MNSTQTSEDGAKTSTLQIQDLHVTFYPKGRTVHAVKGVSFQINSSERVAIIGESGCGKSQTARAILQLIPPYAGKIDSGKVIYDGVDLLSLKEHEIRPFRGREIGIIFQDARASLSPLISVGEQIVEAYLVHHPLASKKEAKSRTLELLELVQIEDPIRCFDQYPHELSGGMCQRIMIALALAPDPKILIADEPTTALDVTIQVQILTLLKKIQEQLGMSILFITHDFSLVFGFCHRALVMYAGQIVEEAAVDELFYNPKHPYTKALLRSIPSLELPKTAPLEVIDGYPPDLSKKIQGCPFEPRCKFKTPICSKQNPSIINRVACWIYDPRFRENYERFLSS
jgi:oligopeptide/dipeptide ABC transporter ATP-binding protein